ncbi:hypothetical protein TIFTF001_023240 [Ficus carica]|uniref:Uncharacterized protein n=1 Tax=Ficus carica TaxID=3494 RepID=A0AA88DCC2_FICCA|nr:hypothetical protein TIFTF001_023240 [Ficus carica]
MGDFQLLDQEKWPDLGHQMEGVTRACLGGAATQAFSELGDTCLGGATEQGRRALEACGHVPRKRGLAGLSEPWRHTLRRYHIGLSRP